MTPLADLLLRGGGRVTGCDANPAGAANTLAGAELQEGHDPDHTIGCGALVVTSAVPADHPEIAAARARGIPVLKRAQALGAIVNRGTVVGVAGTHGKTTTTALTTAVLASAGLNPTGLVGGRVRAWGGNLHPGSNRLFVVEADEYDRSFLTLQPRFAVVTTLEADHLDIYGSLAEVEKAFLAFVESVPADGAVLGCADDGGVGRLFARLRPDGRQMWTYGTSAGSMIRAENVRNEDGFTRFSVRQSGKRLGEARVALPGLHNVRNALAAVGVGRCLDVAWKDIAAGLESFQGVDRRFERVGEAAGVVVVDDYAHHPTEVAATLTAARSAFPGRRVVAVFQPHLYSRTRDFAAEFGRALAIADAAVVTDVYAAREAPIDGITGEMIVETARAAGVPVDYVPERADIPAAVAKLLRPDDVCLTLGAGDLNIAAREILALLQSGVS